MATVIGGRALAVCVALWLGTVAPALAHPHIFVDSSARIIFDAEGRFTHIEHHWVFDEAFSAWVTQGLDADGDGTVSPPELQELADDNLEGLSQFGYYTFAGEGGTDLDFHPVGGARMELVDGRVAFDFAIAPGAPYEIVQQLEIEVSDPDYYVAFTFADADSGLLENAPLGCSAESHAPRPLSEADARRLAGIGADIVTLPPDLKELVRDQTNIMLVSCPLGARPDAAPENATTAIAAIDAATRPVAAPFGGPPPERNLPMPKTGVLGWINAQQKAFYIAMSDGLAAFRSDGSAFVVLGLLSFLYGIFHAAGPGHGKVVVSSYMLAGERQLKTGIALSFAAALMQSVTAVVFVLVAAAALNLTSSAMSGAAFSIEIFSYILIVVLGAWLLLRKLMGGGHHHDSPGHEGHGHDGHAEADHAHHHVVVPSEAGNLREAIGLVLAVGLRPCSGALVVLVFALSQGVLIAGIAAVFLMGLGTALTVSLLASLAVGAKALAMRIGSGGDRAERVVSAMEVLGALLLLGFGLLMLAASFTPY